MPISGDFDRLQSTIRGLRALANIPAKLAAASAVAIKAEIDREFATSTDPYGQRWAPHALGTVRRWGKHPLLRLTGEGQATITVKAAAGSGITIHVPSEGLTFAQGGTKNEPRRRILPDDRMPKTWRIALEKVATDALKGGLSGTA